jgi:serine/threonine-protein kinase
MGEVYRAVDTKLNRSVAIKRMSGDLRFDPAQRRRFIKEAERASQLNDPNIAALYDILEEHDEIYLVMEFVAGSNIREYFQTESARNEFLTVAIRATEGLRTAHAQQIIHCDIKPENIMMSLSGQVKILDFGLARQLTKPESFASLTLNSNVGLSGTPGYMAPEVMLEETPGPQSDIFSLGVVFYEILSGRHPFRMRTVFETADSVLHTEPEPLSNFGISRSLSAIVAKMIVKDRDKRYQSADELIRDLEIERSRPENSLTTKLRPTRPKRAESALPELKRHKILASVILLIALAAAGAIPVIRNMRKIGGALGLAKAPQVAVLPFLSIGGQQSDKAFADGLSDVITTELTELTDHYALQVIPANEVRSGGVSSAKSAREQFGVDMVVEGSIQAVANMWRASYSVVDAHTGRQVKAGSISVPATDPFGLQDQLASSIIASLGVDIKDSDRSRFTPRGTTVSAAYDNYLQGMGYLQDYHKAENLDAAIAAFNQSLRHDSSYALAYAGLGETYWHKFYDFHETTAISDAALACQRALSLDGDLPEGHRCLGWVYSGSGKYAEAAQQLELALAKRPTDDVAVRALGATYSNMKDFGKAEATFRRAIDLRPHYWASYSWLGAFYIRRGQYDKAIEMFQRVIAMAPENIRGYNNAGAVYLFQGNFAKAIELFERSVQLSPSYGAYSNLGTGYFYQHRYSDAVAAYAQALRIDSHDYAAWGNLGDGQYFAPGQRSASEESYAKAVEMGKERLRVNPQDTVAMGNLAVYHAMLGRHADAKRYLDDATALKATGPEAWYRASVVHAQAGRVDDTLVALQSGLAAGLAPSYVTSAPYFESLHTDPRFQQLIQSAEKLAKR